MRFDYGNVKHLDKIKINFIGVFKKCISKATPTIKSKFILLHYLSPWICIKN